MYVSLNERWHQLWKRLGTKLGHDFLEVIYEQLVSKYQEPTRAYHTLSHIGNCIRELDEVRLILEDPDAIEFSLWYHDLIYNTRPNSQRVSNERESAIIAQWAARLGGLSQDFADKVFENILATEHTGDIQNLNARIVVDIDLAILGQLEERFDEYERQIRLEYDDIDEVTYRKGRSAILCRFIARPSIYYTEYFRNKYERQARVNLDRSIQQLSTDPVTS